MMILAKFCSVTTTKIIGSFELVLILLFLEESSTVGNDAWLVTVHQVSKDSFILKLPIYLYIKLN